MKRCNSSGMTLMELFIGIVVTLILIAGISFQIKWVVQRAKVSAAKATIAGLELCLSSIKDDTNLYPQNLSDIKESSPPVGFSPGDWYGPYGQTLSLTDPWGNPYFYKLTEGVVFGPGPFVRETGPPLDQTFTFSAPPGGGTLIVDNHDIASAKIWLNGVLIVAAAEFYHGIFTITKSVTLLSSNTLRVWMASQPSAYLTLRVASPFSSESTFDLRSYGRDGSLGGAKYDADIICGEF